MREGYPFPPEYECGSIGLANFSQPSTVRRMALIGQDPISLVEFDASHLGPNYLDCGKSDSEGTDFQTCCSRLGSSPQRHADGCRRYTSNGRLSFRRF